MARCNDCNKFCSLDTDQDAESNLDVNEGGDVTGDVVITNACAECGSEVTTATLDVDVSADEIKDEDGVSLADFLAGLDLAQRDTVESEVEETATERTSRTEGKGRGQTTFYGARVQFDVTLTWETDGDNGKEPKSRVFSGTFEDDVQASSMDTV